MGDDRNLIVPGRIRHLLRHCSPVIHREGWGGIVYDASGDGTGPVHVGGSSWGMGAGSGRRIERADIGLDLSLPTGAIHALWWLERQSGKAITMALNALEIDILGTWAPVVGRIRMGCNCLDGHTDSQDQAILRAVILHVAGAEDAR